MEELNDWFDTSIASQRMMAILRGFDAARTVELAGRAWDLGNPMITGCGGRVPPTKKDVAAFSTATSSRSRRFSDFSFLISSNSSLVTPSRRPASTSACTPHPRTVSRPRPSCLDTASAAAVTDGYSCRCSVTRRTARALTSGLDFFGISPSSWTHKTAASNLGRFTGHVRRRHRHRTQPISPRAKGRKSPTCLT